MAIDPRININENQVVFRTNAGHTHDGRNSSLIDTRNYSAFDFVMYPNALPGSVRRTFQENNVRSLKTFIVSAVEERVLNPQGIRIQANAITAREIVSGTITAGELASNVILVNNIIRSSNFDGTFFANGSINSSGNNGWAITYSGSSVFNNVTVRGTINATGGSILGRLTTGAVSIGQMSHANSYYHGIDLTTNFTSCFIRGDGGEVFFRADNGTQWLRFDNGVVTIKATNFEITQSSATFSGVLAGATGFVTGNFRVGEASITGTTRLRTQASTSNSATFAFVAERLNGENILTARADGFVGVPDIPTGTGVSVFYSGGYLYRESSSIKTKENVEYYNQPILNFIKKFKPVTFTYKRSELDTDFSYSLKQLDRNFGLIVEDIEEIQNEVNFNLINYDSTDIKKFHDLTDRVPYSDELDFEDMEPKMYRTSSLLSICIKAIQELSDKIEELETRLENQQGV